MYVRPLVYPSFSDIHLFFHLVTNDSNLPYTRKNHRRTTCPPNTHPQRPTLRTVSNVNSFEFSRISWSCYTHCSLSCSPPHPHSRFFFFETSDMSPRKYYVASEPNYSFSPVIQMSLYFKSPPALSLSTIIWRYVLKFVNVDAKELLANCGLGWNLLGGIRARRRFTTREFFQRFCLILFVVDLNHNI